MNICITIAKGCALEAKKMGEMKKVNFTEMKNGTN